MTLNPFDHMDDMFIAAVRSQLLPPEPVFSAEELSNFGAWVKATGMRPEGARDFNLDKYPYQKELYDEDRAAMRSRVVIMKAAQTGLTVKLLNRSMWLTADVKQQINVGLGFPTQSAVEQLAASRFKPQLYTSARMVELIRAAEVQKEAVNLVRLGVSNMRFLGLRSGVSNDSNPLDAEFIDEVRLVPSTTVERFLVRVSESTLMDKTNRPSNGARGLIELNSTAGFPNQDIHRYFLESTQGYWATPCPDHKCYRSRAGIVLALEFAENPSRVVGQDESGRYYLRCPTCGARLTDDLQQHGFYVHQEPDAQWIGYHFSQLIKGEDFLNQEIMPAWNRGINVPEFYNSRLGLPYLDTDAIPAPRHVVEGCCDDLISWVREPPGRDGKWRALGLDQRAPEKHIVIKSLDANGVEVLEHLAVVEGSGIESAREVARIAVEWGCSIVVIDGEPSYDFAIDVARLLPRGLVWFSDYVDGQDNIIRWEDKRSDKAIRKASGEVKYEFRVLVDRYKGLDWSLGKFGRNQIRLPRRSEFYELRQARRLGGVAQSVAVAEEYMSHLGQLAKYRAPKTVRIADGQTIAIPGEYVLRWRFLHVDPHFAHANLSASVGLARRAKMGTIDPMSATGHQKPIEEAGLDGRTPSKILAEQAERRANSCGLCRRYQPNSETEGTCQHPLLGRRVVVRPTDAGCQEFSRRRENGKT